MCNLFDPHFYKTLDLIGSIFFIACVPKPNFQKIDEVTPLAPHAMSTASLAVSRDIYIASYCTQPCMVNSDR